MLTAQEILSTTYRRMREKPIQLCVYETEGDRSYSNSEFLAMIGRCTNYLKENGIARKESHRHHTETEAFRGRRRRILNREQFGFRGPPSIH